MSTDKFEELLPWYVNGTLSAEDRAWVERHLDENPEARAELEWFQSLQSKMMENAPAVPVTIGLSKVMHLIQGDRPTWKERINAFLGLDNFALRPALVVAGFAIIAVQAGFIFNLVNSAEDDADQIRALRATKVEEGPMLRVNFAPDAKEADIRHLLISVEGRIAGGPGQLGDYFIAVPAGKENAAADALKGHPIVQAVTLAPGLPPRE
jgi:hypothetical protein